MLFAIALLTGPLFATVPEKYIRQYIHAEWQDQLPHGTILSLAQSHDGYVWLGTYEGLARFNGSEFALFDKSNTSLEVASVAALLEDSSGSLWIGTVNGGLYRFEHGTMTRVRVDGVGAGIHALAQDSDKAIWIASDLGVARITRDGKALALPEGAPRDAIRWIGAIGNDVWLTSEGEGLFRYTEGRFIKYTTADGLSSNIVFEVAPSSLGLLVGTDRHRIDVFANGRFSRPSFAAALNNTTVTRLSSGRDGSVWFTTDLKGVCHFTNGRLDCETLTPAGTSDIFRSMLIDREGNVWLGGTSTGLHRLTNGKLTPTSSDSAGNSARVVTEAADGTIWAGLDGGGLQRVENGRLVADPSIRLPSGTVRAVVAARDGSLWVGGFAGLSHIARGKTTDYNVRDGLSSTYVYALEEDAEGSIWIGTTRGVCRYRDGKITAYPSDDWADVRALHRDRSGKLWVGTRSGLRCLTNDRVVPCGQGMLPSTTIFSFYEDSDGSLWIGTNRGLVRLRQDRMATYTMKDGMFDDIAFAILDDGRGSFWLSSNKGVCRISKGDFDAFDQKKIAAIRYQAFDKSDGMPSTQCNGASQPAGWKSRDGRLWFATGRGLVTIDPTRLANNTVEPPVSIEQILVNRRVTAAAALDKLASGSRDLEFHYAALTFIAPEKTRFRYMLDGYDKTWIDADNRRAAFYANVPAGHYQFRVIAANSDGVWNSRGAFVRLSIAPHFYETWWFQTFAALALLGTLALAHKIRTWKLKQNERRLVALVAQRTEELRDANVALEKLATTDPLTQVANRRSFQTALSRMWTDHVRSREPLGAILCDVDFFKRFNDTYGHQAGDNALVQVANVLAAEARRATDVVARFGGEEFIILLGHTSLDDAAAIASKIVDHVRELRIPHAASDAAAVVTVSLGVAAFVPEIDVVPEELIREADEALYWAKEHGRNNYATTKECGITMMQA